ncbi:MAG: DciA family protein [Burkholderiales bacterium]
MTSSKLGAYFNDIPLLRQRGLERLAELQRCYAETVPSELVAASRVGDLEGNALIIMALNGPVAAKIKLLLPDVLRKIQLNFQQVTVIRVVLQVNMSHTFTKPKKRVTASSQALKSLGELESGMVDSPLKTALQKLLKRQGKL